ncbi:MAG: hypothetical protein RL077_1250, partial [Verrucomicrobiota bacterium]
MTLFGLLPADGDRSRVAALFFTVLLGVMAGEQIVTEITFEIAHRRVDMVAVTLGVIE